METFGWNLQEIQSYESLEWDFWRKFLGGPNKTPSCLEWKALAGSAYEHKA